MRIVFLCVFLINIVFFIWEYRKGAPEIYWPPNYEKSLGSAKYKQKILLLSEVEQRRERPIDTARSEKPSAVQANIELDNEILPVAVKLPDSANAASPQISNSPEAIENNRIDYEESFVKLSDDKNSYSASDAQETDAHHNNTTGLSLPLFACYQLNKGEYTQNTLLEDMHGQTYKLALFEQQPRDENSYLVLTQAANSLQEAKGSEEEMQRQKIEDLWLFPTGLFKWRISLGLFSNIELAEKAKEQFSEQTDQILEVVPSYLTVVVTSVKISTRKEQGLADFEQKFSSIIDQKIECENDQR